MPEPPAAEGAQVRSRVLVLGGTGEARALAGRLAAVPGLAVTTSLAGRVADPLLPPGEVRVGGFGGPEALAAYLTSGRFTAVVDATHPFAARVTAHAVVAAGLARLPLLVLRRPGWTAGEGDDWRRVPDVRAAAEAARSVPEGATVLLTLGRRLPAAFAADANRHYLIRSIEAPDDDPLPPRHTLLLARGPFTPDGERALLREHRVALLVTKDSGGSATAAKLDAARAARVPVVVIDRPPVPEGVHPAETVDEAVAWVLATVTAGPPPAGPPPGPVSPGPSPGPRRG